MFALNVQFYWGHEIILFKVNHDYDILVHEIILFKGSRGGCEKLSNSADVCT